MTKTEFKEAMRRGLGRCVRAVEREPEKYRDLVLWACRRDIADDAQIEGTRSWYVYTMARAYPDPTPFIHAAAEALRRYHPKGGWDLLHLSELLMFFAHDGYEEARRAVEEKYQQMLANLSARRRRPEGVFHAISDLEQLGLVLTCDRGSFLRIAGDFGRLYREKKFLYDGDFAWFFASRGERFRKTMESAARTDENIACFLRREEASLAAMESWRRNRKTETEALTGIRLSRRLANRGDREAIEKYAAAYRERTQPEERAKALEAFSCCPYPGDPRPILADAQSSCEPLRHAAFRALEQIRHPAVREFALGSERTPEAFAILMTNYRLDDAALVEEWLRALIARKDWDGVHAAGMAIRDAFKDSRVPNPRHLLPLLYEYNPCSYCREDTLIRMARYRMATEAIWEECLWDSNDDIRRRAEKRLRNRK